MIRYRTRRRLTNALVYLLLVIAITAVQKRVERRMAQSDRN